MAFDDTIQKVGLRKQDIIDSREAKYSCPGEDGAVYSGYVVLTSEKLIFISSKRLFSPAKIVYEIKISQIQKIIKFLKNNFTIFANTAGKDANFLKKLVSTKNAQLVIKDGKTFVEEIKKRKDYLGSDALR